MNDAPTPLSVTQSVLFFKSGTCISLWDAWIYHKDGVFHLYYLAGPFMKWDGIGLAVSRDGVHWDDRGKVMEAAPGVDWVGSGAVWRLAATAAHSEKFIMNFSEWRGTWPEGRQTIFFAESRDLIHWTRLGSEYEFQQDERWYEPNGRWDNIWTVPRPGGGYYGYWAANPKDGAAGAGFGESLDGLNWNAGAPVLFSGLYQSPEVSAVHARRDRYYALVSQKAYVDPLDIGMVTTVADCPQGPFVPSTKNFRLLVGNNSYFPRFLETPDGILVNHHCWETGATWTDPSELHVAPLKRAEWDDEGTLRLKWWDGNELAKARPIDLRPAAAVFDFDARKTLILEGEISEVSMAQPCGIFLEGEHRAGSGFLVFSNSLVAYGDVNADGSWFRKVGHVSRDLPMDTNGIHFRLVRNGRITEFYLNDYLMHCYSLPPGATGRIGLLGSVQSYREVKAWYCE